MDNVPITEIDLSRRVPTSTGTAVSTAFSVPGALVTLARFPAMRRLASHVHERACLTVLLDGVMAERIGGRERYCERASVLIKPGLEQHADEFGRAGSSQIILEPLDLESDLFGPFKSLFSSVQFSRVGSAERLACRLARELDQRDSFSPLAESALTFELLVEIARHRHARAAAQAPPAWLRRTHECLHDCAGVVPTLAELAREAGVHPAHLARAFRAHYDCSIGTFVRRRRVDAAARDLVTTRASIAAIAAAHGFSDQSHFTRQFRRHTGMTPSEYRHRVRSQ